MTNLNILLERGKDGGTWSGVFQGDGWRAQLDDLLDGPAEVEQAAAKLGEGELFEREGGYSLELIPTTFPQGFLAFTQPDCTAEHRKESLVNSLSANFQTMLRAASEEALALLECELVTTGESVAVVCAIAKHEDESVRVTPFAVMPCGNPYEMLLPPEGTDRKVKPESSTSDE